jgi:hypothetical protein
MRAAILVGLMLVYRSVQPVEIYGCTDPEGAVTFSQTRCAVDARRVDLSDRPRTDRSMPDRDSSPETRNAHVAAPEPAPIDGSRPVAERTHRRDEREKRARMRMMAIEADRWGREAWRHGIPDEKTFSSSTQQRR